MPGKHAPAQVPSTHRVHHCAGYEQGYADLGNSRAELFEQIDSLLNSLEHDARMQQSIEMRASELAAIRQTLKRLRAEQGT